MSSEPMTPAGEGTTPLSRPPVVTATDEWLARISDQLEQVISGQKTAATGPRKPSQRTKAQRAEVRGD